MYSTSVEDKATVFCWCEVQRNTIMILFLRASHFLISSLCTTSHVLGFFTYDYSHYLLILGLLIFNVCTL